MHNRSTRSNENTELLNLPNQELGRIERANRRARRAAEMMNPVILQRNEAGVLTDQEGHVCNAQGQRLDGEGNPIVPAVVAGANLAQEVAQQGARAQGPDDRERTLADFNRPDEFYRNRSAIRLPTFDRNDFELKPSYYTLVGQHPFHGLSHEHPMDHIERFEDLVTSMKHNGVSYDYLFCKLFPHSLGGEAAYWLKQLPTGSLTNWDDTKKAFLRNFYDDARSEELRNKILQFAQGPTEAFKASWVRFRAYQRDCPHHGFSKVQLLGIFYRGVDWRYQMALDSASNGNFNTRSRGEAEALIENLASSNSTKNADFERQRAAGNIDGRQIAELKNKLDSVHNILVNKKSVQFAAEVETFEHAEEDVNYIGGTGFQNQRYENNQNRGGYNNFGQRNTFTNGQNSSGYAPKTQYQKPFQSDSNFARNYGSSSYQTPPAQPEQNEMKAMLEQLLEGQRKISVDFNGKMDAMYTDLNGKFEALNTHMKKLDTQVAQTAEAVKRQDGTLPGRTENNPRYPCNAITLRSGKELNPVLQRKQHAEKLTEIEKVEAEFANKNFTTCNMPGSNSTAPVILEEDEQVNLEQQEKSEEEKRKIFAKKKTEPSVTLNTNHRVTQHAIPDAERNYDKNRAHAERVYTPKLPFPMNPKKTKQELYDAKCKAMMEKLTIEIPLIDAIKTTPVVKRCLKRMLTSDINQEEGVMMMSEVCSAIIQNRIPKKLKDPGGFVLDCSIFKDKFKGSLCDLGSSVSVMPYSVAEKLGMTDLTPTKISLILADRSVRIPEGVLEDVPVRIGECIIPTDFVVLKYNVEPKDPLILGRPFLATAGALFDVKEGKISLNVGNLVMHFDMNKLVKRPDIDGQTYYVDTLSNLAEEVFHEMHTTDPLESVFVGVALEKEQEDDIVHGYVKRLDASECVMQLLEHEELSKASPNGSVVSDWSTVSNQDKNQEGSCCEKTVLVNTDCCIGQHTSRTQPVLIATDSFTESCDVAIPDRPWYADIADYFAADANPPHFTRYAKKNFEQINDKRIISREFKPHDKVLLYNSRLQFFPGKLCSRWSGPFTIKEVLPYGAVVITNEKGEDFTVNGQRVKHYWANAENDPRHMMSLASPPDV